MYPQRQGINISTAYLLWALGLFGFCGIHRIYMGRTGTGVVWLLTGGLCVFGQLIDLFLIPSIAEERNRYLWERERTDRLLTMMETGQSLGAYPVAASLPKPVQEKSDPMLKLLKAAAANNNVLSVGQAMISTEMPQEEVEELLKNALRKGIAHVDNDPATGGVRYYFDL